MYATQCPVCLSELVLNERKVVRLPGSAPAEDEAIFTCLVCGSDVVAAWLPAQPRLSETVEEGIAGPS